MSPEDGYLSRFPLLGPLEPGTVWRGEVTLPGPALAGERWPVMAIAGAEPGPVLCVNAGLHGGEYPAIEAVIQLGRLIDPIRLRGVVVLLPVVNLPGFWHRAMFVCPVDGLNPNRVFPGDPTGSYTQQLVHAFFHQFMIRADVAIDLHGGDIVEELAPFAICRRGTSATDRTAQELAAVFGVPTLVMVDGSVQPGQGTMSFLAAAERGVPAFIAEAGGVGQLQPEAVALLRDGVLRVLGHLGMFEAGVGRGPAPERCAAFQWLYSERAGMFYREVRAGEEVRAGQRVGRIGSFYGETSEEVLSPVAGRVLFVTTSPAVQARGLLMGIGVPE